LRASSSVLGVGIGVGRFEEWRSVVVLHCDVVEVVVWEGTMISLLNVYKVCASAQSSVSTTTEARHAVHGILDIPRELRHHVETLRFVA
jgi:hypothetical protein